MASVDERKLLIIGDSAVGKTCILKRYVKDEFTREQPTIAGQYLRRTITLNVWDTAGQERFYSVTKQFFRHADAAIVVYDVTNRHSYEGIIQKWVDKLHAECDNDDIVVALAGNKCDLEDQRKVSTAEAMSLAANAGMLFGETSAAASIGITELFQEIAEQLASRESSHDAGPALVQLNLDPKKDSGCPC
ncbi:rab 5 [Thecamonas trahens ATCC 50062]|uniref:Rab 5 n=1 Tax=Thecamonas trahens ATCC 50062 TaxID=461836 RepID=A0A0L0DI94_THETB|nr:rab 5 [Thecamonas trahens ATCC 50062]KNC51826.1 rab 5 [Thecamonas trahens ATCC 50062]|eukprot:XP_013755691.1 rab 5 [Thecamonas trahens ATCC 50062]